MRCAAAADLTVALMLAALTGDPVLRTELLLAGRGNWELSSEADIPFAKFPQNRTESFD
jgi:hypothetical protein